MQWLAGIEAQDRLDRGQGSPVVLLVLHQHGCPACNRLLGDVLPAAVEQLSAAAAPGYVVCTSAAEEQAATAAWRRQPVGSSVPLAVWVVEHTSSVEFSLHWPQIDQAGVPQMVVLNGRQGLAFSTTLAGVPPVSSILEFVQSRGSRVPATHACTP